MLICSKKEESYYMGNLNPVVFDIVGCYLSFVKFWIKKAKYYNGSTGNNGISSVVPLELYLDVCRLK